MRTLLFTAAVLACAPAGATTMTFDSPSVTRLPGQTRFNFDQEGNYKLTRSAGTIQTGSDSVNGGNLFFPVQTNGSPIAIFTLTTLDGSLFTLNSYDTAGLGRFAISAIQPQTATQGPSAYAYNADFTTTGFSTNANSSNGVDHSGVGVSEVDFTVYTFAAGSSGLNLDNVVVNAFVPAAPAAMPEAATWATMLAGFGAIGAGLRRRKVAVSFD